MGVNAGSPSGNEYPRYFPLFHPSGRMCLHGTAGYAQNLQIQADANARTGTGAGNCLAALPHALQCGPGTAQNLVATRARYWRELLSAKDGAPGPQGRLPRICRSERASLAGCDLARGADVSSVLPARHAWRDSRLSTLPRARALRQLHLSAVRRGGAALDD